MSYPEPQYHGSTGEASATFRPADAAPEVTYANGTTAHYLATGASTGGTYGLYRWVIGPEPSGPGPHFHRSITESFYVLSGHIRIYDGRRWIDTSLDPPHDIVPWQEAPAIPADPYRAGARSVVVLFADGKR